MGHVEEVQHVHELEPDAAIELASAWVTNRANELNIRALIIKGPIAHFQGLRERKTSSDVDVLVEPKDFQKFVDALRVAGWYERTLPSTPWLVEMHSTTLVHDAWPIDVDVHLYWPGFLADRSAVFDSLWASREPHVLAGFKVFSTDPIASLLVLVLHSLRRPVAESNYDSMPQLIESAKSNFPTPTERIEIYKRAEVYGATNTARVFLEELGFSIEEPAQVNGDYELWKLNAVSRGYTAAWLVALYSAPWKMKLPIARRALFPSASQLKVLDATVGNRLVDQFRATFSRLIRGIRQSPRAIVEVSRYRRAKRARQGHD